MHLGEEVVHGLLHFDAKGIRTLPMLVQALRPSVRFATNASIMLLAVASLIWLGTGYGVRPSLSGIGPWVGQPVRLWAGHDRFHGRFVGASVNGIVVEDDPLATLPTRLDALDLTLTVRASDTVLPPRKVSLLRIVDGHGKSQLSVTARGPDLLVDFPVVASGWGLRTPAWLFADAARIPADSAWRWRWTAEADRLAMQSGLSGEEGAASALSLSIGLGWLFVHPFAPAVDRHAGGWTALWVGWWMGLLGWFAGRLGWRSTLGCGAAALLSMVTASMLSGIPYRVNELLLAAVAFGLSAAATRGMKREQEKRG